VRPVAAIPAVRRLDDTFDIGDSVCIIFSITVGRRGSIFSSADALAPCIVISMAILMHDCSVCCKLPGAVTRLICDAKEWRGRLTPRAMLLFCAWNDGAEHEGSVSSLYPKISSHAAWLRPVWSPRGGYQRFTPYSTRKQRFTFKRCETGEMPAAAASQFLNEGHGEKVRLSRSRACILLCLRNGPVPECRIQPISVMVSP
jgi:hypothetical protein